LKISVPDPGIPVPDRTAKQELLDNLEVEDARNEVRLRRTYAYGFLGIVALAVFLVFLLVYLVGFGVVKFSNYDYLGSLITLSLSIFGIVRTITKYLFTRAGHHWPMKVDKVPPEQH